MHLHWQYLGPCWDRPQRGGRLGWKQPITNRCRYRLSVVESRRDPQTRKPRKHVLVDLGVVDDGRLDTQVAGQDGMLRYRNKIIEQMSRRVQEVQRKGVVSTAQSEQVRTLINTTFPTTTAHPVLIPEQVRKHAHERARADLAAREEREKTGIVDMINKVRQDMGESTPYSLEQFNTMIARAVGRE